MTIDVIAELGMILRVVIGMLLGGIIGFERWRAGKPAGIRTLTLIGGGAALFTAVSILGFGTVDGSRIVVGVITGIGFLGAGAIIHRRQEIIGGLTSAATIWTVAAIGMAAGTGFFVIAGVSTLLVLVVLLLIGYWEKSKGVH
jgi:putative Mg2+ transporter-C (MgtC) family protein